MVFDRWQQTIVLEPFDKYVFNLDYEKGTKVDF